jgi:hypothetical protein
MEETKEIINVETLPSKQGVIDLLKKENPVIEGEHKYTAIMIILEVKKITSSSGILKAEYYNNDTLEHRGSLFLPIGKPDPRQPNFFDDMIAGENKFLGFTLDTREAKIPEKIAKFFQSSFKNTKVQDWIPGLSKKGE